MTKPLVFAQEPGEKRSGVMPEPAVLVYSSDVPLAEPPPSRASPDKTPVSWMIDPNRRVLHVRVVGAVSVRQVVTAARAVLNDDAFRLGSPVVLDLRDAEPAVRSLTPAINRDTRANPGDLVFGRIAIVADDVVVRAFAYHYKRVIASFAVAVKVFYDFEVALAWCERDEHPSVTTEDGRWLRHEKARQARAGFAKAAGDCIERATSGPELLLSDATAQAVHDCVRDYTLACRGLGAREEDVHRLVTAFIEDLEERAAAHPAFLSAIQSWVTEAYNEGG